ncbi:MobA/MobL family protein [Candidatus Saccharibacteria bacterium]|nr:MobA/MobL family protein [Candidatus Saccharibacteria bacterium]MBR3204202.1 MobA/MobL family protein [Candidatus Saccharibacteria bacterium]
MAMYHFRIKSDKKPNGTKISAVKHVEYINREGKFSTPEQWKQKNKFGGDFISSEKFPNAFGGQNFLLYKTDDFGSIRNTQRGIEVTKNASEETIAIALVLAYETMNHQPLVINGSEEFKKAVLKTAVLQDLPISFDDLIMQNDFLRYKEVDYPDRKNFALHTAQKILQHIEKTNAQSHLEYINRERAYENRGACIFHAHRLPKWAKNDPKKFFQAADKYEGTGHRRYVEIEFALPNELKTVEQYRQIIDAFIAKHLSDHYYAYAIHDKIGMLSGQRHPHVHIMFSERLIDDVEKIKERSANAFFLYPARKKKDGSLPSFEEKWKRGAPKDRKWCNHQYVTELRADFANIQNAVLEQNGYSIRVDHRSLEAQKEDAEQKGDSSLARLFSRVPEKYIGVISCQDYEEPRLERLKIFRGLRERHFDLVMKLDASTKEADELEVKDDVHFVYSRLKALIESKEYSEQKFLDPLLADLKNKMLTAIAQVNKWKRSIISQHEAEEKAKLEYMAKSERILWLKFFETLAQKKHLELFLKTLKKPDESDKEATRAFAQIASGVKNQIADLDTFLSSMKKPIEDIRRRLDLPDCKNNILLVTHQILQANIYARKMLKRANIDLDKAVDDLRNALFVKTMEEPQTSFKTREVYDLIRKQYHALKKEHEDLSTDKFHLQRQIISPQRAIFMAKNIFVHGEYKRLREAIRRYKKDEQLLAPKLLDYAKEEKEFQTRDWSVFPRSTFLQVQYYLTKQQTLLELEKNRLDQIKDSLKNKQAELESLCRQPDAAKKIEEIATGILRKNLRFVRQLEEIETRIKELIPLINHSKEQMNALEKRVARDKVSTRYRVTISNTLTNNQAASLIADAILSDPQAVQLVARFDGNNLEMEKDWELMSELDKDELLDKEIVREL